MTLQNTDLLAVRRGSTNYKLAISDKAKLQDDDLLVVERGSTTYKVAFKNIGTCQPTDLFLVERGTTPYKCTWAELDPILSPPVGPLRAVGPYTIGYKSTDYLQYTWLDQYVDIARPTPAGGVPPYSVSDSNWEIQEQTWWGPGGWQPYPPKGPGDVINPDTLVRNSIVFTDSAGSSVTVVSNEIRGPLLVLNGVSLVLTGSTIKIVTDTNYHRMWFDVTSNDFWQADGDTTWTPWDLEACRTGKTPYPFQSGKDYNIYSDVTVTAHMSDGTTATQTARLSFTWP